AGSRLYVERAVLDEFLARFVAAAEGLRIGDPKDASTELGPLASETHWRKVRGYVENSGGKILTGGLGDGWVVKPTVVVDVPADAPIQCEEVSGRSSRSPRSTPRTRRSGPRTARRSGSTP